MLAYTNFIVNTFLKDFLDFFLVFFSFSISSNFSPISMLLVQNTVNFGYNGCMQTNIFSNHFNGIKKFHAAGNLNLRHETLNDLAEKVGFEPT